MIFLGTMFGVELFSVLVTTLIFEGRQMKTILNIPENGYRVVKDNVRQFDDICIKEDNDMFNNGKPYLDTSYLIPFVNIIKMHKNVKTLQDNILQEAIDTGVVRLLSDDEKNFYTKLDSNNERYLWALSTNTKEEVLEQINDYQEPIDYKEMLILDNPKIADECSVSEVDMLSRIDGYGYRLGLVNDRPIAIIGVYSSDIEFNCIGFGNDSKVEHSYDFIPVTLKEAANQNLKFSVYSYVDIDEDKLASKLENINYLREYTEGVLRGLEQYQGISDIEEVKTKQKK